MTKKQKSQLYKAKMFLVSHYPTAYTPEEIKSGARLSISISTLAPKLRQYSRQNALRRDYFMGKNNRSIVVFYASEELVIDTRRANEALGK